MSVFSSAVSRETGAPLADSVGHRCSGQCHGEDRHLSWGRRRLSTGNNGGRAGLFLPANASLITRTGAVVGSECSVQAGGIFSRPPVRRRLRCCIFRRHKSCADEPRTRRVDERVGVIAEETGRPDVCGTHKRLARDPQADGVGGSGAVGRLCKPVSVPESRPALIISHIADKPFIGFGQSQLERGLRAPTHRHESFAR